MKEQMQEDRNDDISQLFRNNENQLEERPSFDAWDRLERKLDSSRRVRKRNAFYRYSSLIAASIGAIALILAVSLLDKFSSHPALADAQEAAPIDEDTKKIAEFKRKNQEQALKKRAEEEAAKNNVLTPNKDVLPQNKLQHKPIASNIPVEKKENSHISATKKNLEANPIVQKERKKEAEDIADVPGKVSAAKPTVLADNTRFTADEDKFDSYDEDMVEMEEAEESPIIRSAQASPNIPLKDAAKPKKESKDKADIAVDAAEVLNRYNRLEKAESSQKTHSINEFFLMEGDWKDASIGGSYESWELVNGELVGNGFVVIGKDTSFVEAMKIYQKGNDVFFEGPVDASQKVRKFKLVRFENNTATFERKGKNFPNQVVISFFSKNSYAIVYQTKEDSKISNSQELYFNYRNRMNAQRAARNMRRAGN